MPRSPSIARVLLTVSLVASAGAFAYATLWRTFNAPDFDVNDFKAYYAGALALDEGRADLLYPDPATLNLGLLPDQPWVRFAVERGVPHPSAYIYPPLLAVALRPLALLPYHRANQIWFLLNASLFAASLVLLAGWRASGLRFEAAAGILLLAINFHPTYRSFACGQVGLVMLLLTAGALWALERDRDLLAGSAVALAAAIKLTPAILIVYFLAVRRYRAAAAAVLAGLVLLGLSVAGAGWENHVIFVRDQLPVLSRGAATFANQSLTGFLARIGTGATMNAFEFLDGPSWLNVAGRAGGTAILVLSLWLARRISATREGGARGFGLVVMASLLASPITWEHHYVLALVPLAVLLTQILDLDGIGGWAAPAFVAAYVLLAANAYDLIRNEFSYGAGRVAISYAFFGAAGLWLLLARGIAPREARP
jgi:alpha-1,2-mannosyltransferase